MPAPACSLWTSHLQLATRFLGVALVLLVGSGASRPALATPVTVIMTGTLDLVDDPGNYLGGSVTLGSAWTATFTYEDSVPNDLAPDPNFGNYSFLPPQFSLALVTGPFTFTHVPTGFRQIGVIDRPVIDGGDLVGVDARTHTTGGALPPLGVAYVNLSLYDWTGTALSSDALTAVPWTAPLSAWPSGASMGFFADILDGNPLTAFELAGEITGISVAPEPGTFALVSLGLLALGRGVRRRI